MPDRPGSGLRHLVQSDNATVVPLAAVIVAAGALCLRRRTRNYLSAFNISNILLLATALGFIALGQTVALLMGGIDLSVGPLAGFLVVVASFFINDGQSPQTIALGFALMFVLAAGRRDGERLSDPLCQFHARSPRRWPCISACRA